MSCWYPVTQPPYHVIPQPEQLVEQRIRTSSKVIEFYDLLQQVLKEVPPDEMFILLGDFNAQVGEDAWGEYIYGPHRLEQCNDSGCMELLAFLLRNEASSVAPGSRKKTFTSRYGNTQSQNNGIALTLPL